MDLSKEEQVTLNRILHELVQIHSALDRAENAQNESLTEIRNVLLSAVLPRPTEFTYGDRYAVEKPVASLFLTEAQAMVAMQLGLNLRRLGQNDSKAAAP